jgi:hypothetical protein
MPFYSNALSALFESTKLSEVTKCLIEHWVITLSLGDEMMLMLRSRSMACFAMLT